MDEARILEIKQSVFANNDQRAELLRRELKEKRIFLLNLMSSPGSGKTTTLTRTIERLRDEFKIGVMEADIDSDVDARTIAATGVKSIQLHTGGMCHLDADMTRQGLDGLAAGDVELAVWKTWAIWDVRRNSTPARGKTRPFCRGPRATTNRSSTR